LIFLSVFGSSRLLQEILFYIAKSLANYDLKTF
jgi:hypothetical protein